MNRKQGARRPNQKQPKPKKDIRIAMPCFGEEVAPCFEAAHRFRSWSLKAGQVTNYREDYISDQSDGLERVRMVSKLSATVVICNGIGEVYRNMLVGKGVEVIHSIVGTASDALFGYLAGRIQTTQNCDPVATYGMQLHTADLVEWTRELFTALGWTVGGVSGTEMYPVDLIVEKKCPVCSRLVRAAICCGAHAYRVEEEVREFARVTANRYNARVYVHQPLVGVGKLCRDFEIELLNPDRFTLLYKAANSDESMAPLKEKINGHEKLNVEGSTSNSSGEEYA